MAESIVARIARTLDPVAFEDAQTAHLQAMRLGARRRAIRKGELILRAMREPTDEMCDAAADVLIGEEHTLEKLMNKARAAYISMIDAALNETK